MTFSPSRIDTWLKCNRKAAWQYIAGYEDPGNEDTDFGKVVHAILESYKRDGIHPNMLTEEGACAAEAIPFVEDFILPPHGNAECEGHFFVHGRHKWQGYKDLSKPGDVLDYKTSGNLKWAKTAEDLQYDPQAVVYATHAFAKDPGLQEVKLTWLYLYKRKPYKARPTYATMTRSHALRAFAALEVFADEFQAAADAAPADPGARHRYVLDVIQPNTGHCDAYRGCPHRARCGISFFSSPNTEKGDSSKMNLLAQLQEMDRIAASGGNPLAPVAPRAETPPMMGVPAPFAPAPSATMPVAAVAPPTVNTAPVSSLAFGPGGAFAGLGPAPAPAPVVQQTPNGTTTFNPGFLMQPDAPPAAPDPMPTERQFPAAAPVLPEASAMPDPGQINPPKRGRGRPPGSKNKPKECEVTNVTNVTIVAPDAPPPAALSQGIATARAQNWAPPTIPAAPAAPPPPPAATQQMPAAAPSTAHTIGTLYVGCVPHGLEYVDLDTLVAKAKLAIGPADYFKNYGYKANGALLQMVEAIVQHDRPDALVVRHPNSPEATLCLSMLFGSSETVVEALR